ncbi:sensor histidine kinase [Pseudorhodoplanes sinuspersici]|uniref:sensor histidine kinase n=1 Tax=Pseudorhodoplanes sinuspersici TaxID=1235591 RepID=UPI000FF4C9EE|nr:PAS domain-containing sensor histidine kinase [Pseudorhodoplanes sinuspersici]RKE70518.1 PAS domain-containing protein [Pseudorhodoplanes sinuspersici]
MTTAAWTTLESRSAYAQDAPPLSAYLNALTSFDRHELAALGLTLGVIAFGVVTSIMLVRTRQRASLAEAAARREIETLSAENDRVNALLLSEPQIVVAWAAGSDEPDIIGDVTIVTLATIPQRVLAFGSWLAADQAQLMQSAVDRLRNNGEAFAMTLNTLGGKSIEAEGRAIGGRAVMRLRDVSGIKGELAALAARHERLVDDMTALRTLVDSLPFPVWARDREGRLDFVNAAYAGAVEAADPNEAVERNLELLDRSVREEAARTLGTHTPYRNRVPTVIAGARRIFDVVEMPTRAGSAGIGVDFTELENLKAEMTRMIDAHRRTLDQLATGVAIFGADHTLRFYNEAYRALWDLDASYLDHSPTDTAVLDRLRASRKLPEQQDFRSWKNQLHEAYRALEAKEDLWHLPDGRTLRVVTTPNTEGGVTYLFDNVTERLDLERRYDALIRVQGETLDNLAEAVAVFASDGRLRLHNPAFADMWNLPAEALAERPHIEAVIAWCAPLQPEDQTMRALRTAVTSIGQRESVQGRLERRNGTVVDVATLPLPDGATLVTFQDVTDSVNVERALRERNEALVTADEIKINFLHHVSYELRSPLTNIIGFAHFLGDPSTGPLTGKQSEYLGYITVSTNSLLALINDILDLASIDADAMTLTLGPVDIRKTVNAAAEGIGDRLMKDNIKLDIDVPANIGEFSADERRVRQILYNLLSNAVGFSPPGSTIRMHAERTDNSVVFSVTDQGPGIPPEMKNRIFDWFETHPLGSQHRGAGLGLSIVRSFVQLHGGTVSIDSAVGQGTTVTCTFPIQPTAERIAAA